MWEHSERANHLEVILSKKWCLPKYLRVFSIQGVVNQKLTIKWDILLCLSLENRIQDREHKFRMVLLGTEKVSEITHFAMDCPIRKSLKKMSLNAQAEPIKLYKKTGAGRNWAYKCSIEVLKHFKNLSTINLQGIAYKNMYSYSKKITSYIYNMSNVVCCPIE